MTLTGVLAGVQRRLMELQRFRVVAAGLAISRELRPLPPATYPAGTPYYDTDLGVFTFRGTYREMGRQFAEVFPMTALLRTYRRRLHKSGEALRSEVRRAMALIARWHPDMLAWLEGVADGHAGHTVEDAVLGAFCTVLTDFVAPSSCSAVAVRCDDGTIVGQNLDLGRSCPVALARVIPSSGLAKLSRITVGYPWLVSFANEAGLVVCGSSINVNWPRRPGGDLLPQEMVADLLLSRAASVDEVIDIVREMPPIGPLDGGLSLIAADRGGRIRYLEMTGRSVAIEAPSSGPWITTNHFRDPDLAALCERDDWTGRRLLDNSIARYRHAIAWYGGDGAVDRAAIVALLRTAGPDGAWRRMARWPDLGYTTASFIVDLRDSTVEYWIGPAADRSGNTSIAALRSRPLAAA